MARGEVLRLGVIKDSGILCQCSDCKGQRVFNVSGFEKHAGSNARHPSDYIFLGNGKSLKEIIEAGIKVKETGDVLDTIQKVIEEGADRQVCVKCHKGGAILHCVSKSCSRFYHQECVGLHTFPEGKWLCPECLQIDIREPLLERNFLQRRSIHHPEFGLQLKPRDPSLHKALFLPGGLPDGTKLGYYDKGQCLLIGTKSGSGICCSCCNQVVSCSQFEVHAGWGARRNPYNCIHLLDGMSLHDVAVQRGNVKSLECDDGPLTSVTGHDHCSKCGLDGELVHCGSCSRAYHLGCTALHNSIDANWSCAHCITKKVTRFTKIQDSSSMAKDRVQGRCKRVVKAMESIASGCALCKCGDFTKLGFNERTVLLCDQCEKEFHVGCLKVHGMEDLKELPQGEWFCGKDCQHIHEILHLLVLNGPEPVPGSIASKVIAKLQQESQNGSADSTSFNLTWQILHGKRKSSQQGTVLDDVMDIFSECFDPIVDAVSGEDLIPLMVYSHTKGDQEFGGMHCIVLKFNEEVLSASIVRILGKQLAEMPLVATRLRRRSLGCCEALLQCVERLLGILQIRQILVPAAEGAEGIWLRKFGFSQMPHKQLQEFFSQFQMMVFSGSSVMQKAILSLPGIPENSKLE
ncbi:hypothetical protein O6H91_Y392000 [Diphasiastrum complanatum]|nr:hypothetical protein O6H91_Y392000 [Diphasiastrum complanatum]